MIMNFVRYLFPIYRGEWKKFIPMALMLLFILFNYTVLRNLKDALVINASGADETLIAFLKLYGTLPAAALFVIFYTKVSNYLSRERIFYISAGFLIAFFGFFGFMIYPNLEMVHASDATILNWQAALPSFLGWTAAVVGNWSFCLFFIFAELWGSAILSLFFWQFANDITKSEEAKRFYPLFGFIGNFGLISAGYVGEATLQINMQTSIYLLMSLVVTSGLITLGLYSYMNAISEPIDKPKKNKPKLGLLESFRTTFSSPHVLCIALIVLSYGITINFIDVLWKGQVKMMFEGDNSQFLAYMAGFSKATGFVAVPLMLLGGPILRALSWRGAASIVPVILMVTSVIFYGAVIFGNHVGMSAPLIIGSGLSVTALQIAVGIGKWQGALTKASKYSLFDATKEMAYIPLDPELKSKGKAAVDVTGGRLGKSGGSWVISTLKMMFPTASTASLTPYLAAVSMVVFIAWIAAVFKLSKTLDEKEPVLQVDLI